MLSAERLITAVDEIASSRPDGRSTVGVITSTPVPEILLLALLT